MSLTLAEPTPDPASLADQGGSADELDWQADALCAQTDPELFFPRGPAAQAKRICRACPVIAECLCYALSSPVVLSGVWGATTERERRGLRSLIASGLVTYAHAAPQILSRSRCPGVIREDGRIDAARVGAHRRPREGSVSRSRPNEQPRLDQREAAR